MPSVLIISGLSVSILHDFNIGSPLESVTPTAHPSTYTVFSSSFRIILMTVSFFQPMAFFGHSKLTVPPFFFTITPISRKLRTIFKDFRRRLSSSSFHSSDWMASLMYCSEHQAVHGSEPHR